VTKKSSIENRYHLGSWVGSSFRKIPVENIKAQILSAILFFQRLYLTFDRMFLGSKCLYGCNTGGVCQPSLFECVCTEGFHKRGHQCIRGRL